MRILIDGHMLGTGEGGNERYIKALTDELLKRDDLEIVIAVTKPYINDKKRGERDTFKEISSNNIMRVFYDLPRLAKAVKADILHSTYVGPVFSDIPFVLTVHDMGFKRYPEFFSIRERMIFSTLFPISLKKAKAIIVPSKFTKKELLYYFPECKGKVFVTYEATGKDLLGEKKVNKTYNMFEELPYILAFNSPIAKKNINRVTRAFKLIKKEFPAMRLIIVGGRHNIVENIPKDGSIQFLQNIKDAKLNVLYNNCKLVVYFSLYEGFGLPLVEAFSFGKPVIASDIEVHKEIADGAALFVNPKSSMELAKMMEKVLKSRQIQKTMSKKAIKKSRDYLWNKTAQKTVKVYKTVLK